MRKQIVLVLIAVMSMAALSATRIAIGTIYEEDFRSVGGSEQNIGKAKGVILEANKKHQLLMLERQQLELEINKYMLEGSQENWDEISGVFDKLGSIEAELMKNKLKSQIEIRKYISEEQYIKARSEAVRRFEDSQDKIIKK